MPVNEENKEPTLDDNPGLEHSHATREGELLTGAGSTIQDPHGNEDGVTLENDPGLEHDDATAAGRMMTAAGSTGPHEDEPDTESEDDVEGQRLAENEQEHPRTVIQKVSNAIEDIIPGDSDDDGH